MEYSDETNKLIREIMQYMHFRLRYTMENTIREALEEAYSQTGIRMSATYDPIHYEIEFNREDLIKYDREHRPKVSDMWEEAFKDSDFSV